ncbi:MAG: hypothetical protein ABWZ25_20055 [Chitinophagaceae bacterium]
MEVKPILSFGFDISLYEDEVKMKGYCNDILVILPDFTKFKVCFYDPIRLSQDLEDEGYIAEPGLIVIKDVTRSNMERTVYELWLDGFFDSLMPLKTAD